MTFIRTDYGISYMNTNYLYVLVALWSSRIYITLFILMFVFGYLKDIENKYDISSIFVTFC